MRLIGAPTIAHLVPSMLDITNLSSRPVQAAPDALFEANYERLSGVGNGLGAKPRL